MKMKPFSQRPKNSATFGASFLIFFLVLTGCQHPAATSSKPVMPAVSASVSATNSTKLARRYTYIPRPYPVDEHGFSPVDKALAKAYAREEMVTDDAEGALNP